MGPEDSPSCARHEGEVRMHLATLHSESVRPDQLIGVFECPLCGFERRLPLPVGTEVA